MLNYYSFVDNKYIFHKLIGYILRHSCAKTLGRKLRIKSRKQIFKKYGRNLRFLDTNSQLDIPVDFKKDNKNFKINNTKNQLYRKPSDIFDITK